MVGRHDTASGRERPVASAPAKTKRAVDIRHVRADDFRYLFAIARSGTRRSAALDLGVDHTTVSRRIRALEKMLGVRLIERGAVGWELTDIGRSVAERARAIEESVQEAVDAAVGDSVDSLRGRVRVTAPDGFGTLVVTPALARLRMKHPHLSVELLTATRQMNLQQSGFDVAIAVGATVNSRLVSELITPYSMGIYAAEGYIREHGAPESIDDVRNHPIIFFVDSLLQVGDLDIEKHLPRACKIYVHQHICSCRSDPRRRWHRAPAGLHGQPAPGAHPAAASRSRHPSHLLAGGKARKSDQSDRESRPRCHPCRSRPPTN